MYRTWLVAITALAMVLSGVFGVVPAAAESADGEIEITGHGWGHGRGMSQYGAYGYAAEYGWTATRILDHYYGKTTQGSVPADGPVDPGALRVDLRFMRGRVTTVALAQGALLLRGVDDVDLGRVDHGAVRLRRVGDGYEMEVAAGCAGPWTSHTSISNQPMVRILAESTATGADALLQACGTDYRVWYEGELQAVDDDGFAHTVNVVTVEEYLRGVVPNEMPALWTMPALEAQAVAARSYALAADSRQQPYADTCDTTRCQVYDGVHTERGGFHSATHARTDAAIVATAGIVRLTSTGAVARTEFSSSSGGYSAGGDFPAVVDVGDSIFVNPNHNWSKTVSVETIEERYRLGSLRSAQVTERNGLGADGGRVVEVEFEFSHGTAIATGESVRSFLGLKSDWFSFGAGSGSELRATTPGGYIDRTFQNLAGRSATNAELVDWYDRIDAGDRRALTDDLVGGSYFTGFLLDDLYFHALGRLPDSGGRVYWIGQISDGLTVRSVGVLFYGSPEYYMRSGNADLPFVTALYRDVLGRNPDEAGRRYWLDRAGEDSVGLDDIAAGFYDSLESRMTRATRLHDALLGPVVSAEVGRTLANRLLSIDDLELAAEIAASVEAYSG